MEFLEGGAEGVAGGVEFFEFSAQGGELAAGSRVTHRIAHLASASGMDCMLWSYDVGEGLAAAPRYQT